MKLRLFTLILTVLFSAGTAAEETSNQGAIGAGGDFAYQTGAKGALTNRNAANELYTGALNAESQAWSRFPPNIKLLAKSFSMGRDASKVNAQSEEFARASLHALATAKQSGNYDPKQFNMIDEAKLKEWATVQNPNVAIAKKRFDKYEKYGIKLGGDNATLKTPVGDLDLRGDISTGVLTSIASALGYDPNDVTAGLQEGIDERNRILAAVTTATEAELAAKLAAAKDAGDPAAPSVGGDRESAAGNEAGRALAGAATGAEGAGNAAGASADDKGLVPQGLLPENESQDAALRVRELEANMEAIRSKMGAANYKDPIGRASQNIFTMVHDRYETVSGNGRLLLLESPVPATAPALSK